MPDPQEVKENLSIPIQFDRTRTAYCLTCDESTRKITHPWIIRGFRGGDNLVRREICKECGNWSETYITAAVVRGCVPQKRWFDKKTPFNLGDLIEAVEAKEKHAYRDA